MYSGQRTICLQVFIQVQVQVELAFLNNYTAVELMLLKFLLNVYVVTWLMEMCATCPFVIKRIRDGWPLVIWKSCRRSSVNLLPAKSVKSVGRMHSSSLVHFEADEPGYYLIFLISYI